MKQKIENKINLFLKKELLGAAKSVKNNRYSTYKARGGGGECTTHYVPRRCLLYYYNKKMGAEKLVWVCRYG